MDLKKAVKPNPDVIACPKCHKPLVWKKFKMWYKDEAGNDVWTEFPCLDCNCKGEEDEYKKVDRKARSAGIPEAYRHEDFSDWVTLPGTERMHSASLTYAGDLRKNVDGGVGALFVGAGYGTGKSKSAYYIQVAAIKENIETFAVTSTILIRKIRSLKSRRLYTEADDYIDKLIRVKLLIYDDLGKTKPADWDKADVESIILDREINNKATIFTTNKDEDELDSHLGAHLTSRLYKMSNPYIVVVESKIDMRKPENRRLYLKEK